MQETINELIEWLNRTYPEYLYEANESQKFYKITSEHRKFGGGKSAYGFVAKLDFSNKKLGAVQTGDIFKADSWSVPAKHKRAQLFQRSTWAESLEQYSPAYLK